MLPSSRCENRALFLKRKGFFVIFFNEVYTKSTIQMHTHAYTHKRIHTHTHTHTHDLATICKLDTFFLEWQICVGSKYIGVMCYTFKPISRTLFIWSSDFLGDWMCHQAYTSLPRYLYPRPVNRILGVCWINPLYNIIRSSKVLERWVLCVEEKEGGILRCQ